jgi:glycosyltransferase involved in cell wall biosynthesis
MNGLTTGGVHTGRESEVRTSIVVVAHNEGRHIGRCLESLSSQEEKPGEIILVAHNCSDETLAVAGQFPAVRVVRLTGHVGTVFAHQRGTRPEIVAVTNPTLFGGNAFIWLTTRLYFYLGYGLFYPLLQPFIPQLQFWSTSFACRKADFEAVGGYAPLIAHGPQLRLSEWAEDYYLSSRLRTRGTIALTLKTVVHSASKQRSSFDSLRRFMRQREELAGLDAFLSRLNAGKSR